nr:MAG TPA: hypothetical protein [Caudoviricetes sp.]
MYVPAGINRVYYIDFNIKVQAPSIPIYKTLQ